MRKSFLFVLAFICTTVFSANKPRVYVRVPVHLLTPTFIQKSGFIQDHGYEKNFAKGYIDTAYLRTLSKADPIPFEVVGPVLPVKESLKEGYTDYKALTARLEKATKAHPEISRLVSAGKSVQGRNLWYVMISDNIQQEENEPNLLYVGNMHGDEVVGREILLNLVEFILNDYGSNQVITHLVDHSRLFILPSMNPDGFELGQRFNANGTDLNRNFPDWIQDPNDSTAGREPETKALMALSKQYHFAVGMNWHGGEICINIPWDGKKNTQEALFGDNAIIHHLAHEYSVLNRPMFDNHGKNFDHGVTYGYEWYPIYGGLQDYFNVYGQSIQSTGEMSVNKWPPGTQLAGFWNDNRDALLKYLDEGLFGIAVYVADDKGQGVTDVTVTVASIPNRPIHYKTPYIFRPVVATAAGTQEVTIQAKGFKTAKIQLDSKKFEQVYQRITLVRE